MLTEIRNKRSGEDNEFIFIQLNRSWEYRRLWSGLEIRISESSIRGRIRPPVF